MTSPGQYSIGESSERCLDRFSKSLATIKQPSGALDAQAQIANSLDNASVRFKLWASNIGVFAERQRSLDFRVRELPDVKELFLQQLDLIVCRLEQVFESARQVSVQDTSNGDTDGVADPPSDNCGSTVSADQGNELDEQWTPFELVQSMHECIDWLHRLSNLVRKASFGSQNRWAESFRLLDASGNPSDQLTREMTDGLARLYKTMITRPPWKVQGSLVRRLTETMIIRHKRILYRRSHEENWDIPPVNTKSNAIQMPLEIQHLETSLSTAMPDHNHSATRSLQEHTPSGVQSNDRATTVDTREYHTSVTPSRISKASPALLNDQYLRHIPDPPKLAPGQTEFICPFCFLILPRNDADKEAWIKHVRRDLDPYICVFEECDRPNEIYSSSKAWLSHMSAQHRMRWQCIATDHEPLAYETPESFTEHMKRNHSGYFKADQLPMIVEMSYRPIKPTLENCPFCDEMPGVGDIEEHVGQHLRQFALISLPLPDYMDTDKEYQNMATSVDNAMTSDGGTRKALSDFSEFHTPTENVNPSENDWRENSGSEDRTSALMHQHIPTEDFEFLGERFMARHMPLHIKLLDDEDYRSLAEFAKRKYRASNMESLMRILHTSSEYRDQIKQKIKGMLTPSVFGGDFLPENLLSKVAKGVNFHRLLPGASQNLIYFIKRQAIRIFLTVLLSIDVSGPELVEVAESFKQNQLTDKDLPIEDITEEGRCLNLQSSIRSGSFECNSGNMNCPHGPALNSFHIQAWSRAKFRHFFMKQWSFSSPVFEKNNIEQFQEELPKQTILPFIWNEYDPYHTGPVFHAKLHAAHQHHDMNSTEDGVHVALKELKPNWSEANIGEFGGLDYEHLILPISTFKWNEKRYIMFEWADNGSLRDFWKNNPDVHVNLDGDCINEFLVQLHGLTNALCDLHTTLKYVDYDGHWHYGDLKPENIMVFKYKSLSRLGTWKIANFGLAQRQEPTFTSSTMQYVAPEAITYGALPMSQSYDIWSMGCIILESIIWLLYGCDEPVGFYIEAEGYKMIGTQVVPLQGANVSVIVTSCITIILEDPVCEQSTALRKLIEFVRDELLVVNVYRANASELHEMVTEIRNIAKDEKECSFPNRQGVGLPARTLL